MAESASQIPHESIHQPEARARIQRFTERLGAITIHSTIEPPTESIDKMRLTPDELASIHRENRGENEQGIIDHVPGAVPSPAIEAPRAGQVISIPEGSFAGDPSHVLGHPSNPMTQGR